MPFLKAEIKLEDCYRYLYTKPLDDLKRVRRNYDYYNRWLEYYGLMIWECEKQYLLNKEESFPTSFEKDIKSQRKKIRQMNYLTHGSYLAILLYHQGEKDYKTILNSLRRYFILQAEVVQAPLKDFIIQETEEIIISKESYIQGLKLSLIRFMDAEYEQIISNIQRIITLEKEILEFDEEVLCLCRKKEITYGDL